MLITDRKHWPQGMKTMTNGERAEIADKANFLAWMLETSAPVPNSPEEYHALMDAWIKHRRRNGIWA